MTARCPKSPRYDLAVDHEKEGYALVQQAQISRRPWRAKERWRVLMRNGWEVCAGSMSSEISWARVWPWQPAHEGFDKPSYRSRPLACAAGCAVSSSGACRQPETHEQASASFEMVI